MKRRTIYIAGLGGLVCLGTAFGLQVLGQQNNGNGAKRDARYPNPNQLGYQSSPSYPSPPIYQNSPSYPSPPITAYAPNQTRENQSVPFQNQDRPTLSPTPMMVPGQPMAGLPGYPPIGPQYSFSPSPMGGPGLTMGGPGLTPFNGGQQMNYNREVGPRNEVAEGDVKKSFEASQKIRDAVAKFRNSDATEKEKKAARAEIESQLKEQFRLDQKRRRNQLEQLEQQVTKLRKQLEKRDESQSKIIELRMQLLDNDADGLSFPESFNDMNIYNGGPAVYSYGSPMPSLPEGAGLPPGTYRNGTLPNGQQDRVLIPNYTPGVNYGYPQSYATPAQPTLPSSPGGEQPNTYPRPVEDRPEVISKETETEKVENEGKSLSPQASEINPL